jgi:hypothetical protein
MEMRAAFTSLLALFFIVTTCVLTLVDGAVRTAADADAVVAVVNKAEVRPALLAAAEAFVFQGNGLESQLGAVSRLQVGGVIGAVLAKDWFEAVVRRGHQALLAAVAAVPASAILDLRPLEAVLRGAIEELKGRVERACIDVAGAAQCSADSPIRRTLEAHVQQALAAVAHADHEVDLAVLATHDRMTQETVRRWLAWAPQFEWAGLVVLAVLFGLILLINIVPFRRLLAVAGVVLLLAAAAAIGTHIAVAGRARVELEKRVPEAPVVVTRLATAFLDGAAAAARPALLLGGVAGLVLVAAALATRGRRA